MLASPHLLFARYKELQDYVQWSRGDADCVFELGRTIVPHVAALIDDFYEEIERHPAAFRVITGGKEQVQRLKQTLSNWLTDLFRGPYDADYVARRWRVGLKHAEIGLPQVFTAAAMSRLRNGMVRLLSQDWRGSAGELAAALQSLNKLLDLDLAVIGDAYETDYVRRQREGERRSLHEVLHREKELSDGLLTHAQAAVLIVDLSGHIVRRNPFVETLAIEREPQHEPDDWIDQFIDPSDRLRLRQAIAEALPGDRISASSTISREGRKRHLHWSLVPLRDAEGRQFGSVVMGQDVTDLYDAQSRALQAERLAAIGQMATGLAHESRAALQRIGASAEMLELELEGHTKALALVGRIQHSQSHLRQLLEEVRTYAAPIVLDRSPCRISEVWREAWELLHAQRQGRDVELREQIAAGNLSIDVDRFRLVQVFRNLLDNALAATTDPVRIEITCESLTTAGKAALIVRVRDNGGGLSAEQRRRIFEPFYTTKPTGTGLGTAIAQRLVEAHGGTIEVVATSPAGTEIAVTLPVHEASQ